MPDDTLRNQTVTNYWPIKGGRDVGTEGSDATSRPGPGNQGKHVSTLEDLRAGRSSYVTIASDPSRYGQWFTIPSYTYVNAAGEKHTLNNVPAYVHDTGSLFQGRPDKMDIAADYSASDAHGRRLDPDLNRGTVFVPGANANQVASAYIGPRPLTQRFWEQGRVTGEPGAGDITAEMQAHRPAHGSGSFEFEGDKFHWASGTEGHPMTPLGSTQIGDPHHGPKVPDGFEIPEAQALHDPLKRGHGDDAIVLHGTSSDDLDRMYTLGCFGIRHNEWPKFKQDLAAYKAAHSGQSPYINIAPDHTVTITEKPLWGAQVHGVQQAINKLTPSGPKALSTAFWNQGKVEQGNTQVAAKVPAQAEVAKAPDFSRHGQTQTAQAPQEQPKEQAKQRSSEGTRTTAEEQAGRRSRPGSQEYERGPRTRRSEAKRLAQGHDDQSVGSGDARSTLPPHAGGHQPVGDGTARASLPGDGVGGGDRSPYGSSEYVADGSVPGEIVIRVVLS